MAKKGHRRRLAAAIGSSTSLSAREAKCIFMFDVGSFGRVSSINRMAHGRVCVCVCVASAIRVWPQLPQPIIDMKYANI